MRYLRELIEALIIAALFAVPFIVYFWGMKP